ncbi:MAG: RNA polymerase sigma factor [Polyangiales bacterium]
MSVSPERRREVREHEAEEAAWMAAYAAGDMRAFSPLFRALAPRLLAFFSRSLRDRAVCEDLVQTTFTRLHTARASYSVGSPVRPWVFTIAARVRIDELRRQQRRSRESSDADLDQIRAEHDADSDFVSGELIREARQRDVRAAIDALPPGYRIVIHLHRFEELSFPEIGKVLGCTAGAARIRAFRAYAMLREQLAPLAEEQA